MALGLNHNQFGFDSARWVQPAQRTIAKPASPIATLILSTILIAVMIVESLLSTGQLIAMADALGLRSTAWSWTDVSGYAPIFTHTLLHGSSGHFFWNAMMLVLVGTAVEWRLGWRVVGGLFIVGAVVTGLSHLLMFPAEARPLIGASGIVSTMFGVIFIVAGDFGFRVRIPRTARWLRLNVRRPLCVWVMFQVIQLVGVLTTPGEPLSVAYWSHLAGFGAGVVAGILYMYTRRDTAAQPGPVAALGSAGD